LRGSGSRLEPEPGPSRRWRRGQEQIHALGGEIDEIVAAAQYRRSVKTCLESLPDPQREVVHLAFFEDLSYTEIAGLLDRPPGTVKTRMYHAKLNLKKCLQKKGIEGEYC